MKDFGDACVSCGTEDYTRKNIKGRTLESLVITGHQENGEYTKAKFFMCSGCFEYWRDYAAKYLERKCPHANILAYRKQRLGGDKYPLNQYPSEPVEEEPNWLEEYIRSLNGNLPQDSNAV